ncbi:MAG: hypothetical protein GY827_02115 [Cytophagales bacterium]|nr:hypothetical protein [Cytophagales bacterium]
MNNFFASILLLSLGLVSFAPDPINTSGTTTQNNSQTTDVYMLPKNYKVYVQGTTVVNQYYKGFEKRILPTYNHYTGLDGGYVALYTRKKEDSVYSIGGGIHVVGQVRVKGKYIGSIFYPEGYKKGDDITQDKKILAICYQYFPQHKGHIWIGGGTGGWVDARHDGSYALIQPDGTWKRFYP